MPECQPYQRTVPKERRGEGLTKTGITRGPVEVGVVVVALEQALPPPLSGKEHGQELLDQPPRGAVDDTRPSIVQPGMGQPLTVGGGEEVNEIPHPNKPRVMGEPPLEELFQPGQVRRSPWSVILYVPNREEEKRRPGKMRVAAKFSDDFHCYPARWARSLTKAKSFGAPGVETR